MAKARRTRSRAETKPSRPRRPAQRSEPTPAPTPRSAAAAVPGPTAPAQPPRAPHRTASPEAVGLYEHGLDALQHRAFADAATHFRNVISSFPEERELHERARVYLRVCERELASAPPSLSIEDRLMAATVAVNSGEYQRARALLDNIVRERPDNDLAEYMSAVVDLATGDADAALSHLERAISLNPENRNLARQDDDFEALHEREDFRRLVESHGPARRRRPRR